MLISWTKCELLERSQADVYLAVDKQTGKLFVVKTCNCEDKRTTREMLNEITIFLVLETPRVVQYLGSSFTDEDGREKLNLYLEYMPGGSLRKHINRLGGRLEESLIKTYTRDILEALDHLHSKGIVHGDIKADNILVGVDGVKLCDFGGSKFLDHDSRGAMRGTPAWMAPEVVAKLDQGFPSDVWSIGCTVLEMATGQDPWGKVPSKTALRSIQLSRKIPDVSALSAEGQRFIKRCLARNPKQRWTAAQLLEEEFILNEVVDTKTAAMSPALARIRATFPYLPGKGVERKKARAKVESLRAQKPKKMSHVKTPSKLVPLHPLESQEAGSEVGVRPPDGAPINLTSFEPAKVSERDVCIVSESQPSHFRRESLSQEKTRSSENAKRRRDRVYGLGRSQHLQENSQKVENSQVPVSALVEPLHLPENDRDLDNSETPPNRELIPSESRPFEPREKATCLDNYKMSSDGLRANGREVTHSESSTLRGSTTFPVERNFTNHSSAPSDLEKLHAPRDRAQTADCTIPSCTRQLLTKSHDPAEKLNEPCNVHGIVSLNAQPRQLENPPTPSHTQYFSSRRLRTPLTHIPPPWNLRRDHSNHQLGEGSNPTSDAHPTPSTRPTSDSTFGETLKAHQHSSGRLLGCCISLGSNKRKTIPVDGKAACTVRTPSPASIDLSDSAHSATLVYSDSLDTNTWGSEHEANDTCPSPSCLPHILGANSQPTSASRSMYLRFPSASKSARSDCSAASLLSLEDLKHYFHEKTACL